MKFRAPTDTPVHLDLLSGHSAIVTRKWRELPDIFHAEAHAKRCECDKRVTAPKEPQVKAGPNAQNQVPDVDGHLRLALQQMLERDQEGDFTTPDGLPNIEAVSKVAGFAATREDVYRVFREMQEEANAGANGEGTGEGEGK